MNSRVHSILVPRWTLASGAERWRPVKGGGGDGEEAPAGSIARRRAVLQKKCSSPSPTLHDDALMLSAHAPRFGLCVNVEGNGHRQARAMVRSGL